MSRYWVGAAAAASMLLSAPGVLGESRTIEQPAFTAVGIASGIAAEITAGPAQSIEIEAEAGVLDEVRTRVVGGKLEIWIEWSFFDLFAPIDRNITVRVSAPSIRAVEASSGATVTANAIEGDDVVLEASSGASLTAMTLNGQSCAIEASSGAYIEAGGRCNAANVEGSSGARVAAGALTSGDVEVEVSSGAHADVFASSTVAAEASSGGEVVIHGNPPGRNQETSSGGSVAFAD